VALVLVISVNRILIRILILFQMQGREKVPHVHYKIDPIDPLNLRVVIWIRFVDPTKRRVQIIEGIIKKK